MRQLSPAKRGTSSGVGDARGFQAAHMARAGERRERDEVAPDLARRRGGKDAVLGLAAQHLGLGPIGILAQEAPGRGEVRVAARRGAQDRPVDDAGQQRVVEIGDRGARIGVAAIVDRLEGGGQRGGFGGAERLGRGDCLRQLARRGGRRSGVAARRTRPAPVRGRRTANADIRRGLAQLVAAFAAQDGGAALLGASRAPRTGRRRARGGGYFVVSRQES